MNSITQDFQNEKGLNTTISNFSTEYSMGKALKKANAYKSKGIPIISVVLYMLQLVFTKKSMYMNILNGTNKVDYGKDVVYRLINSSYINWAKFVLNLAYNIISRKLLGLTSESRLNAIVVDDTLYSRSRSKKVELLANVHDHTGQGKKYRRGFRLLTLAWTDGVTLIPLMFRHLSSSKKENRYNEINPNIDKRTCGYKARLQAVSTSPEVLVEMLKEIVKMGIPAKHVLFDCWFSYPATIINIAKETGLNVIARLKKSTKIKYIYKGENKTLNQIYSSEKKRRGKSKYLLSVKVELYKNEEKIPARIVFVRDKNNKKNWIAIISTDTKLSEEEVIQAYGKRWDIEVFFKICKSYLKLGSEFQGLSYDSITAHTAIVMVRYMILATEKRQNEDLRSFGELFFLICDEIPDKQFSEALELIFSLLRQALQECLFLSDEEITQIICAFLSKLPDQLRVIMLDKAS